MSERFDDIIRKQLEGHESPVPQDMFDKIRNHPDVSEAMFDASVKNTLQSLESPVATGLFDTINTDADLTNAPFDEAVQNKIAGLESVVPADMWQRITERKRRRRPVAWWWMAAGFLLMISGGTWYAIHQKNKEKAVAGNNAIADKKIASTNDASLPGNTLSSKKINIPLRSDTSLITDNLLQTHPVTDKEIFTNDDASQNNKTVETKADKNTQQKESLQKDAIVVRSGNNQKVKNRTNLIAGNSTGSIENPANTEMDEKSSGDNISTATEDFESAMSVVRLTIMQQLRNAARLVPAQLMKAKPRSPVIPCPVNADDGRSDWYADIYASGFMFNKKVADKEGGKNAVERFDSTMHRQVSYNAGINLVKNIGENILLKTGIQYNRLNESFRLTRINERKLVTTISVRIVIIAPGDTVYIRDTSVVEKIGTIQRRKQNTYQQWDVPVIIGYEFGGENIRLNANAGVIANIRSSYSGELLDTLQQVIDPKNYNGKPVYKTNVGLSLYAGLSIIKPLGERTSLLIEPYARVGLGNTTTENAWFKQKNSAAGISIGLRYKLNGSGQRR